MNSVRHQAQRPLSLMSSASSCLRTWGRLQVAPEFFFKARLLGAEKGIGDSDQADVMMPTQPVAAFIMVQAEFFFQFAIVLFDAPAGLGSADETAQSQWLSTKLGQPVLGGLLLACRPFHQQPFPDPLQVCLLLPAVGGHTASITKRER